MGFFSWMTADTKESIPSRYSDRGSRPVYMLQPNGQPPIHEPDYEGYGFFGGINAYAWLAKAHFSDDQLAGVDQEGLEEIGITLEMGDYYVDQETEEKLTVHSAVHPLIQALHGIEIRHLAVQYDVPLAEFGGLTANQLIASDRLVRRELPRPPVVLKFSFSADAVYERLRRSESCPAQGFFYERDDMDEAA